MSTVRAPSSLADPELYRRALALLRERHAAHGRLEQHGLTLGELSEAADPALCRALAARVSTGAYVFSPVREREAFLGGKLRLVYRAPLADTVVLFALSRVATTAVDASISERVFSYRKGRSSEQAVRELAGFVRAHRAERRDVRRRGLHVLRRDVAGYGDAIPVDESSPLWPLLHAALERAGEATDGPLASMLRAALVPLIERRDGSVARAPRGVPMGSPLQPLVCNLYLSAVDRALGALPGAFYARFGDDLLFSHPDADTVRCASESVDAALGELRLALNPDKRRDLFWNGAGRSPDGAVSSAERGTTHVEYLGARVAFNGGIAPSVRKQRRLRHELAARVRGSEALLREEVPAERLRAVAAVVARALDPKSEVALDLAGEVLRLADDRRTLRELDHFLWGVCARALSGRPGARAFRSVSPRELREQRLPSFVGRRRRAHGRDTGAP
jgi:hypothetical protein